METCMSCYYLYRLPQPRADVQDGWFLGAFGVFDDAVSARDDDAVLLLSAASPGNLMMCHTIVGPGLAGPDTAHPMVTCVPGDARVEPAGPEQLAELRDWLRTIHHYSS
jgi:hypothetical protein